MGRVEGVDGREEEGEGGRGKGAYFCVATAGAFVRDAFGDRVNGRIGRVIRVTETHCLE